MKRNLYRIICSLLLIAVCIMTRFSTYASASASGETVYLGGFATGFSIVVRGAEIVGLSSVITESGVISPCANAGICEGDRLMSIDATEINCSKDIEKALKNFTGEKVVVVIKRNGESIIKDVYPAKDLNGHYKVGLFIRDCLNGIGTMTYIKKNGEFMALGHPICIDGNENCEIIDGDIYKCSIIGVNKGIRGKAGELKGVFIKDKKIGSIPKNLDQGIRGKMSDSFDKSKLREVEIGQIKHGNAKMVTSIDGIKTEEYDISVVKVEDNSKKTKNFVIKVTDQRLINNAGGIVQGMSGSPILQNGKLVGAVTHVFVNDPTRGYGILINNMLEAK